MFISVFKKSSPEGVFNDLREKERERGREREGGREAEREDEGEREKH